VDTAALAIFVHAAETGSLSAAGRLLGLSPTLASRRLAALEEELGVRLMHRTTRSVRPTPDGEAFLAHAQVIVEAEEAGRSSISGARDAVVGVLRVTAPAEFGRVFVAPLLPDLLARHDRLTVELVLTDNVVDIVAAGIDVAVRIARLRDSSLVARKLASNPVLLCASPSYLDRAGPPSSLSDVARHECLMLAEVGHWSFEADGRERQVKVGGRLRTNSIEALREACVAGLGLALLSAWKVEEELRSGELVAVDLPDGWQPAALDVWAVYPSARLLAPKVRVLIDALSHNLPSSLRLPT
jgi:DNA-binding transcriptional LysR family regulator